MSAYAGLYFDSDLMVSVKNGIPYDLLSVFSDVERRVLNASDAKSLLPFIPTQDDEYEEDGYFIYQTRAAFIRDRLDLMGINLIKLKSMFEITIKEFKSHKDTFFVNEDFDEYSYDYWKDLVEQVVEAGVSLDSIDHNRFDFLKSDTFRHHSDTYGFPDSELDFRYLLRILLDCKPDTSTITLDYTDLVLSGYENPDSMLCSDAINFSAHDYSINEKIVVLTEGTTDIFFLKNSLRLLYPHIFDNFAFADFSEVKAPGGISSLVSSIKTIISMSIKNRVIAIFDADAAALDALRSLKEVKVPNNIKIISLPVVDRAKLYPTIGPSGMGIIDINGLACSTEIYLPSEAIKNNLGEFHPVHWRGYIPSVEKYQGEITNKRDVFKSFASIVKEIDSGEKSVQDFDWSDMRSIFSCIFESLSND